MPPRRFFRRSSSARRFRRRGPGTHAVRRPQRWQWANFNFPTVLTADSGIPTDVMIPMAQIFGHFGDDTTAQGRALNAFARFIEVGGIVFNWNCFLNQAPLSGELSAHAICSIALVTQRLASNGFPATLFSMAETMSPINQTISIAVADEETRFPTRVHWRDNTVFPIAANDLNLQQAQIRINRPINLRLRLRLDDEQGLFFAWTMQQSTGQDDVVFTGHLQGSLYYRIRM